MKKTIPLIAITSLLFLSVILFVAVSGPKANAASEFTGEQAQQFVASLPAFADLMKKITADNSRSQALAAALQSQKPVQGYHPTATLVSAMKQASSADYNALSGAVGKFGFQTPEAWAATADSINLAYMAIKISQEGESFLSTIAQITPEQEAAMPPEQKAQFQGAKTFINLLAEVPEESRKFVKPYITDLDRAAGLFAAP